MAGEGAPASASVGPPAPLTVGRPVEPHEWGVVPRGVRFRESWVRFVDAGGPLVVLFYGFPVWWILGLANVVVILAASAMATRLVPMGLDLRIPRGFWLWALFLVSVVLSSLMLRSQAPSSVPGDTGSVLTYAYRLAWYAALTVILLYVGNLDERRAPTRRLVRAAAFMFLVTVAGGLLGVLVPAWEARSALEILLPGALTSNSFVQSLVHLEAAEVQSIIGEGDVRPKAPFAYANTWGAALSAYLPFFLYAWLGPGAGWRRVAAPFLLLVALGLAIDSLNRALWASLLLLAVYAAIQVIRLVGLRAIPAVFASAVIAIMVILTSGAGARVEARLEAGHSDSRRGNLALTTVDSVMTGSPVIGFGNVRRVEGSFASIAGGATPTCPKCEVPQMGTQGHLWLVLMSQGLVGLLSFISFLVYRTWRHIRSRNALIATLVAVPVVSLLQMPFYDILGVPLSATMLALALMWRWTSNRESGDPGETRG